METRIEIEEEIIEVLRSLPRLILDMKEELLRTRKTLDTCIYNKIIYSNKIEKKIIEEVTEEGKKAYPNVKLRDIEFQNRIKDNEEYQQYKEQKRQLEIDIEEIQNKIDFLQRKNSNFKALCYLFAGKK